MSYGIPYDYITPDVFGERYGGGRLPPGTRGYTWTNWQGWLAEDSADKDKESQQAQEDAIVKKFQIDEMKAGVFTLCIVGLAVGVIHYSSTWYENWKKKREE